MTYPTEFGKYGRWYDLLYHDKDYAAEAAFVHNQIHRRQPGAQSLLELGCGTGGHAVKFAELGYGVHGIDLSSDMIRSASQRLAGLAPAIAARLKFEQGDIRHVSLSRQFDAVISLFHVMSYLTADDDLACALASAERHLRPGGVLLFDFWYGPAVLCDPPTVRIKRVENENLKITRLAEPKLHYERNVAEIKYQVLVQDKNSSIIDQIEESHHLRYWFWPELQNHLRAAGLQPLGMWEWMTEQPAHPKCWAAYVACQKSAATDSDSL